MRRWYTPTESFEEVFIKGIGTEFKDTSKMVQYPGLLTGGAIIHLGRKGGERDRVTVYTGLYFTQGAQSVRKDHTKRKLGGMTLLFSHLFISCWGSP